MYAMLYRSARLFLHGGFERQRLLKDLERSQWLSRDELDAQKLIRLREIVKYAYNHVPYYHNLYSGMDIHPEDVKTLKDFESLPFLTKEDVVNHREELVSPEFRDRLHMRTTSGSTGVPMRFYVGEAFWWWNDMLEWRCRGWYGIKEGEKVAWIWGAPRDLPGSNLKGRLKARLKNRHILDCRLLTSEKMQIFAEELVRWKPAMFLSYSSASTAFAQYVRDHQIKGIRPRLIETSAEKLTGRQRQLLEEVFRCQVANSYTSAEFGHIAFECEMGRLHVSEGCHLEVTSNDGCLVEAGNVGEVVLTSIHQFAMPFIRYKINDMAIREAGACPCGRSLSVLREVVGRTNDYVVTANGGRYGDDFLELLEARPEIARYQVYQPDLEHLQVRICCRQKVDSTWLADVGKELQFAFDSSIKVSVEVVDKIELTHAGKHRVVISDVATDLVV